MGGGVKDGFVAGDAALANGIVEMCGAGCGGGDFVENFKTVGLGCKKLVAGVFVGFGLALSDTGIVSFSWIIVAAIALVWEDELGKVWLSYNSPIYLQERHNLPQDLLQNIAVVETLAIKAGE